MHDDGHALQGKRRVVWVLHPPEGARVNQMSRGAAETQPAGYQQLASLSFPRPSDSGKYSLDLTLWLVEVNDYVIIMNQVGQEDGVAL